MQTLKAECVKLYNDLNPATLTGAIDVIVVEQSDGKTFLSSPFHVRFGKSGVALRPKGTTVYIEVNETQLGELHMKLDDSGTATQFFATDSKAEPTEIPLNNAIGFFNLKKGANQVQFSVTSAFQGTTKCYCQIFLWHHSDKIVISDIDGTITKSDVRGQVFHMIGRDWSQCDVVKLFSKIVENGYHIVYLSARAIGQASQTKGYLSSVKQNETSLPDGPVFLNPTSLAKAFHLEVIEKKPESFKIGCLQKIQSLFPEVTNPIYAGFGNRVNDIDAYQTVGIPISRNFTINKYGELKSNEHSNPDSANRDVKVKTKPALDRKTSTYGDMSCIVDNIFPKLSKLM